MNRIEAAEFFLKHAASQITIPDVPNLHDHYPRRLTVQTSKVITRMVKEMMWKPIPSEAAANELAILLHTGTLPRHVHKAFRALTGRPFPEAIAHVDPPDRP